VGDKAAAISLTSPLRFAAPSNESTRPRARAIRKSMSATRTADSGAQLAVSAVSAMDPDDVVALMTSHLHP